MGTKGWRTPSWSTAAEADEPAWPAANDHDGQTRNATSANGWSSAGASTAGSACPGPGASDCHYAGRCSTAGAEADAGREALPIDPAHVPRPGGQDHGDAAGDRQRRARPHA